MLDQHSNETRVRKKKTHSFQPIFFRLSHGTTPTDYLEKRRIIGFQRTGYFFFSLHSIYNLNRVNPLKIDGKKWIFSFTIVCIFFALLYAIIRLNVSQFSSVFVSTLPHPKSHHTHDVCGIPKKTIAKSPEKHYVTISMSSIKK